MSFLIVPCIFFEILFWLFDLLFISVIRAPLKKRAFSKWPSLNKSNKKNYRPIGKVPYLVFNITKDKPFT